jgi:putative phosphoribosyl transferase
MRFKDRREAGRALARLLAPYASRDDLIVLALPRGGVPVAFEIAEALDAPLDVFMVRKLGVPGQEEVAMGAIASGGVRVLSPGLLRQLRVAAHELERVTLEEQRELERRERSYRGDLPAIDVRNRTVILVDDGIATGSSVRAAVAALRQRGPRRILIAAPVAPPETARQLRTIADEVICAAEPDPFLAVGRFYENFDQTSDEEVRELLALARDREHALEAVR